jgi:hypothetical protein
VNCPDGEHTGAISEAICFRGRLTEDDFVALQREADRLRCNPSIQWLQWGLVTGCAAFVAWRMVESGPAVFGFVVLAAWAILIIEPLSRPWRVRRQYRARAGDILETEVSLTADRVAFVNDRVGVEMTWKLIGGIVDTPNGALLFYNENRQPLLWLPPRLFEGNGLRDRVLSLAAANGVRVVHR